MIDKIKQKWWPFPVIKPAEGTEVRMKDSTEWKFPKSDPVNELSSEEYMVTNKIKVMHVFNEGVKGGVTIAYRKTSDIASSRMVEVAVSYCSPKDTFSRKIGTQNVLGLFKTNHTILVPARTERCDKYTARNLQNMFWYNLNIGITSE